MSVVPDITSSPEFQHVLRAVNRAFPDERLRFALLAGAFRTDIVLLALDIQERGWQPPILRFADFAGDGLDELGRAYAELRRLAALSRVDRSFELDYQEQLDDVRRLEQHDADVFREAFEAQWGPKLASMDAALAAAGELSVDDEGPSSPHRAAGCRD